MAVPIIITMIIQALYNVVDSLFVAQLGIKPLSALGIAYPIQMIMIAVSNGIGVGMNSVVSRRMGNGDIQEAGRATGNAITLALIATATMALFGFLGTNTFFQISTNDTEIIAYGTTYLSISVYSVLGCSCLSLDSECYKSRDSQRGAWSFKCQGALSTSYLTRL